MIFNEIREDERTINRVVKYLEAQNKQKIIQFNSVLDFINDSKSCKNKLVLGYFGEISETDCGICSFCISQKNTSTDASLISEKIIELLKKEDLSSRKIQMLTKNSQDTVIFVLQNLLENDTIIIKPNNQYSLNLINTINVY